MVTKQFYTAPEAELIIVRFEKNVLSGPGSGYSSNGRAGNDLSETEENTYSF